MKPNLLTVVIPAKNEERQIGRTLAALQAQTYITTETPIFVADADSTDRTLQIIKQYQPYLNIEVVKGGLPSTGRNNGARHAQTKYILFLDADIELIDTDTLEKTLALAENENLDLVTTKIRAVNGTWADDLFWKLHSATAKSKVLGAFSAGMFILINRDTYQRIGGFNEHIALGEDWELTHQVPANKFAISDSFIYTTNRRFKYQGYLKTIWQYVRVATSSRYRAQGHREYFDIEFH